MIPYDHLKEITKEFHETYQIGQGAHGEIFRATLMHVDVAIKRTFNSALFDVSNQVQLLSR